MTSEEQKRGGNYPIEQPGINPVRCDERNWFQRNFIHNQCYELQRGYRAYIVHSGQRYAFWIAKGFQYDGASIPWFLWTILKASPDGLWRAATLVHDYLYINKGVVIAECVATGESETLQLTRKEVDEIFLIDMLRAGVKEKKARRMYRGVRTFGGLIRRF